MLPAGVRAFERRTEAKSRIYAYETEKRSLPPAEEKAFRANTKAWKFFTGQAPSYQRVAIHWVVSAKKEETRARRLASLIEDSAAERRLQ